MNELYIHILFWVCIILVWVSLHKNWITKKQAWVAIILIDAGFIVSLGDWAVVLILLGLATLGYFIFSCVIFIGILREDKKTREIIFHGSPGKSLKKLFRLLLFSIAWPYYLYKHKQYEKQKEMEKKLMELLEKIPWHELRKGGETNEHDVHDDDSQS